MVDYSNSDDVPVIDDQVNLVSSDPILPPSTFFTVRDFETDEMEVDSESSWRPLPTSEPFQPDEDPKLLSSLDKKEAVTDACVLSGDFCREVLKGLSFSSEGWCELVDMKPTKDGGYVQISYGGANKFTTLGQLSLWASGEELAEKEQCSHRCHRPLCKVVGHVIGESPTDNNSRKGCLVWIQCHHCPKVILLCMHDPCCIKYHPEFSSMESLLDSGVCRILRIEMSGDTGVITDDER